MTVTRRPRPAYRTCQGCGHEYLPHWGFTLTMGATAQDVCMTCAEILRRLGVLSTLTPNDDKDTP